MKINYILFLTILFFITTTTNAQFTDNMESYTDGEPISGGHWTDAGCGGGEGCSIMSTSTRSRSGDLSGLISNDETTNVVLDLGNKIFGDWGLSFWVFIPEGKEASMSMQGTVPFEEENSVVGDILFNKDLENPGIGVITDAALGEVFFNFPHNEWFRLVMNFDISLGIGASTWVLYIDGEEILPYGTPYTNENGDYPTTLGGILFSSVSENNEMYLDDFHYSDFSGGNPFADIYPFEDDMEYESGDPLNEWWSASGPFITTSQANSGIRSGLIPDDASTDVVLDLGNRIQSEWALEFFMFIPSGREGYFNLQGVLPIGAGEWIVGNIVFNQDGLSPGIGLIDDSAIGTVNFNYPEDEWFRIVMNYNLTGGMTIATWGFSVNNILVIPEGTPFTNSNGDIPTSLGGVDFYSISTNNEFYLDDFNYINGILNHTFILSINDISKANFLVYPNPTNNFLYVDTQNAIENLRVYNMQGSLVISQLEQNSVNVSNLSSGIYFIEVSTDTGSSIQKFIKN